MLNLIKHGLRRMVAGEDLDALHRYRTACHLAYRWNGQIPNSAETALWIHDVGDGHRGYDIERFRQQLLDGTAPR